MKEHMQNENSDIGPKVDLRTVYDEDAKIAEIEKRENFLRTVGFSDEEIMRLKDNRPTLYDIVNVQNTLDSLKQIGFTNPEKMITSLPAILGYNIENIKQKIDDLKVLGFTNPEKMITSLSAILGYNIENIERKISALETIFKLYSIRVDVKEFIEKDLLILGAKIDKVWIIARALRNLGMNPSDINNVFLSRLRSSNITDTTAALTTLLAEMKKDVIPAEIFKAIRVAKKLPKDEKQQIIESQKSSKLARRYKRGYGS